MVALKALRVSGEVVTTPFSFVATAHALRWIGIEPVFADIEPRQLTLNPEKAESAITGNTQAILPVHVFGNPCAQEHFRSIGCRYNLPVIYDAAHAFGAKKNGISILDAGDVSVVSFHATKVFNTFEGGAIISHSLPMKKRIDLLRNFGIAGADRIAEVGINAKMDELRAAYGLVQLKYVDGQIAKRTKIAKLYRKELNDIPGISVMHIQRNIQHNYNYFPIRIDPETYGATRDDVWKILKKQKIFCKRYFFPLISRLPAYRNLPSAHPDNLPVAEKIVQQILCLPIYGDLEYDQVRSIAEILKR
jgi:dTDP-4-amino-4,6-dideoxygalactose transaminase